MIHVTERGIRDEFHMTYTESLAVQPWNKLAREITSDDPNGETTVRTMGLRGMEERKGMPNFAATVPTKPFHWVTRPFTDGFAVTADEWNYDKADLVTQRTRELGVIAAAHPSQLVESVAGSVIDDLGTGNVKDPFDTSIAFIGTAHPVNKGGSRQDTTSNYFTKTEVPALQCAATTPTESEWVDILLSMAVQIQQIVGDNNERLHAHIRTFTVAAPPVYMPNLLKAISKNRLAAGGDNVLNTGPFKFSAFMVPDATSTTGFVMIPDSQQPFGLQMLQKPDRKSMTILGPGTEHFKIEEYASIWIKGRYQATHLYWENIVGATVST